MIATKCTESSHFYFVSEHYWSCIRFRQFRDAPVRFRLGVSEILTHEYRYCRGESEEVDVNCPFFFYIDELEDECHFLFRCKKYEVLRPGNVKMSNVDVKLVFCVEYSMMKVVVLVVFNS